MNNLFYQVMHVFMHCDTGMETVHEGTEFNSVPKKSVNKQQCGFVAEEAAFRA